MPQDPARLTHVLALDIGAHLDNLARLALAKHLKMLERAGLISVGQDAQRRPRRFEGRPLAEASAWLEQYRAAWEASLERLDGLLEEMQRASRATKRRRPRATRQNRR